MPKNKILNERKNTSIRFYYVITCIVRERALFENWAATRVFPRMLEARENESRSGDIF